MYDFIRFAVSFLALLVTDRIWGVWHFKAPTYQNAIYFINCTYFKFNTIRQMTYIYCYAFVTFIIHLEFLYNPSSLFSIVLFYFLCHLGLLILQFSMLYQYSLYLIMTLEYFLDFQLCDLVE